MSNTIVRMSTGLLVGAATYALIFWLPVVFFGDFLIRRNGSEATVGMASSFSAIASYLVPGLLAGFLAIRWPALVGALATGLVAPVMLSLGYSNYGIAMDLADGAALFVKHAIYGAVSGAAGAYAHAALCANKSFEPNLPRGSA